jgi:hypothetical protein
MSAGSETGVASRPGAGRKPTLSCMHLLLQDWRGMPIPPTRPAGSAQEPKPLGPHRAAPRALPHPCLDSPSKARLTHAPGSQRIAVRRPGIVMGWELMFQRLGPNAGGGAERGRGRCRPGDVVVVRLVAGTGLGVAGSRFAICGSS